MSNSTTGPCTGTFNTHTHSENISLSVDSIYVQNFVEQTLFGGYPMEYAAVLYALIGPHSNWDQKPFKKKPSFYSNLPLLAQQFIERGYQDEKEILELLTQPTEIVEETEYPYLDVAIFHTNVIYDSRILLKSFRSAKSRRHFSIPFIRCAVDGFAPNFHHPLFAADATNGILLFDEVTSALTAKANFLRELSNWLSICKNLYQDQNSEWPETVRKASR
jgi:hypothetical protein